MFGQVSVVIHDLVLHEAGIPAEHQPRCIIWIIHPECGIEISCDDGWLEEGIRICVETSIGVSAPTVVYNIISVRRYDRLDHVVDIVWEYSYILAKPSIDCVTVR